MKLEKSLIKIFKSYFKFIFFFEKYFQAKMITYLIFQKKNIFSALFTLKVLSNKQTKKLIKIS